MFLCASFRNEADVQMEGHGRINRGPHFPIPVLVLDSLSWANTHSSGSLTDLHENCLLQ